MEPRSESRPSVGSPPYLTTMSGLLRATLVYPLHAFISVLLFSPPLARQAQAFVVSPPRAAAGAAAPHDNALDIRRPRPASRAVGGHRAAVERDVEAMAVAAEEWDGFGEEDHERFLAEFWQKKPLLIRQAVKG